MYELKPQNKQMWIKDLSVDEKIGSLYAPGSVTNQYRLATVLAVATCDESDIMVGDMVLYDTLGAVDHRLGNSMYRTVAIKNVIAIAVHKEQA